MQLSVELMMNMLSLVAKPFLLVKIVCLLGARTVILAFIAWLQLVKNVIIYQIDFCWRIISWTVAVLVLPFRILNALQREKTLEMIIHEMQCQLDTLIWENKELEEQLQIAIKDRRVLEIIFEEIEEEHDKAIAGIDLLENQLQDLKAENMRLNEVHGKRLWTHKIQDKGNAIPPVSKLGVRSSSWSSSYNGSRVILEDVVMGRDTWNNENKDKPKDQEDVVKSGYTAVDSYSFLPEIASRSLLADEALHEQRCIAISRSLFSATLSLLVGVIIWEAEDPCMPLVAALFTVVGMSLYSVVQFFSTINSKPASDAVALLSFNWFILGTLTYPTLPRVAPVLAPPVIWLADWVLSWLIVFSIA